MSDRGRLHVVMQHHIDRYAEASGDFNPLHVDPTFAASTRFGRTVAHGMLILAYMIADVEHRFGAVDWASGGEVDVRFLKPVFAGDTVEIVVADGPASNNTMYEARVGDRTCARATVAHAQGGRHVVGHA